MFRNLAGLFFYARFLRSFSAIGFRARSAHWPPPDRDFSGQRWLITGATGGIGRAVALAANRAGATVLAVARSDEKLQRLQAEARDPQRMIPVRVDLALVGEVSQLPGHPAVSARPIDVLVNNVGVLARRFSLTDEGLETSFATNLLNQFVLTEGLKSAGLLADGGLVVNVSSGGMYGTPLKLDEMAAGSPEEFEGMQAYALHKRAQVELTRYWNNRWQGRPAVQVMHPGWADTEGVQTSLPGFRRVLKGLLRNAGQAADTILWLAEERPPVPERGGIWLDRELQPEHEFAFTKKTAHSPEDLAEWLNEWLEQA